MKEKACGNCRYFKDECADGSGWCDHKNHITMCSKTCRCFEDKYNDWTEITPDNVDEVRKTDVGRLMIAVITHGEPYYMECREMFRELDEMAILGGYYFFVLPKLKIENEEIPNNPE